MKWKNTIEAFGLTRRTVWAVCVGSTNMFPKNVKMSKIFVKHSHLLVVFKNLPLQSVRWTNNQFENLRAKIQVAKEHSQGS